MTDLVRSAPIIATDTDAETNARTLTVQLLRWDDPRPVSDGGRPYIETWARDALVPLERLAVWDAHHGQLVGHMDAPTDAGHGPVAQVHVARGNSYADNVLALIDSGAVRDVSIEFRPEPDGEVWNADRSEVTRTRATLRGVAFTIQGAHDAPILQREGTPMDDQPTQELEITAPPAPEPDRPPLVRADAVADELVALRGELVAMRDRPAPQPSTRYRDLGEMLVAAFHDRSSGSWAGGYEEQRPILFRAWTDITSTDVVGLLPPQQIREILDVIRVTQPLVEAAGSAPAPVAGSITYPKVTLRPTTGRQVTQKTEITSSDTTVITKTQTVDTIAGGNDIAVQVRDWSDPSVMALLGNLYAESLAKSTDQRAYAIYDTAATINVALGTDVKLWVTKLVDLAAQILTASGRFPDRIVLSTDLWAKLAGAVDADGRPIFTNTAPSNPAGSASLTTTDGDVRGLPFVVDPWFPTDRGVMFHSGAFRASLGPVSMLSVENPRLLGVDVAWYRYAAFLDVDPSAMAMFSGTATAPTAAAASKASK